MRYLVSVVAALVLSLTSGYVRADDAINEVNSARAARGLPPFIPDPALTTAAQAAADYRASYLIFGHTSNDFNFLPQGTGASAAGCAAYPSQYGWLSCCTYENHQYAGAAFAYGRDGKRYMHLFVSSRPSSVVSGGITNAPPAPPPTVAPQVPATTLSTTCTSSSCGATTASSVSYNSGVGIFGRYHERARIRVRGR